MSRQSGGSARRGRERDYRIANRGFFSKFSGKHHLFVWLTIFSILGLGLAIIPSLRNEGETQLFVFSVTEYESPIPPNAWAIQDWEILSSIVGDAPFSPADAEFSRQSKEDFLRKLDEFLEQASSTASQEFMSDTAQSLMIYVSAMGVVDSDGEPGLLMSNRDNTDLISEDGDFNAETLLTMGELFSSLQKRPGKKVLLLDATKSFECWRLGITNNPFSQALEDFYRGLAPEIRAEVAIINSSRPGQFGHVAPERGGTAFGTFLAELLGRHEQDDGNSELTLRELVDHFDNKMTPWTQRFRADAQQVQLLAPELEARGRDPLLCKTSKHREFAPGPQEFADPSELSGFWSALADGVDLDAATHTNPLALAHCQQSLARLEAFWQGGYPNESEQVQREFSNTRERIDRLKEVTAFEMPLVGLSIAPDSIPRSELAKARQWWNLPFDPEKAEAPAAASNAAEGEDENSVTAPPADPELPSFRAAATVAWERIGNANAVDVYEVCRSTLERLDFFFPRPVPTKEIFFARMLEKSRLPEASRGLAPRLINAFALGEQATKPFDLRALSWITTECTSNDDRFRTQVFDPYFCDSPSISAALRQVENVEQSYARTQKKGENISAVYRLLDRFYASFHWVGEYANLDDWKLDFAQLVEEYSALQEDLDAGLIDELYEPADLDFDPLSTFIAAADNIAASASSTDRDLYNYLGLLRVPIAFAGRETIREQLIAEVANAKDPDYQPAQATQSVQRILYSPYSESTQSSNERMKPGSPLARILRVRKTISFEESYSESTEAGIAASRVRERILQTTRGLREQRLASATELWSLDESSQSSVASNSIEARKIATLAVAAPFFITESNQPLDHPKTHLELVQSEYRKFQAERILHDFWGDLGERPEFFFLNAAKLIRDPQRVERVKQVALRWRPIQGEDRYAPREKKTGRTRFQVMASPREFPVGLVSLELFGFDANRRQTRSVQRVPTHLTPRQEVSAHVDAGPTKANAFFRGHVRGRKTPIQAMLLKKEPLQLDAFLPNSVRPEIQLPPIPQRSLSIVFVIDCSGSMSDKVASGDGKRFHVAAEQLSSALTMLKSNYGAQDKEVAIDVGFVLFGHRHYWVEVNKAHRYEYRTKESANLPPGDDVEPIFGGSLTPIGALDTGALLSRLDAKGESPLYYAMNAGQKILESSRRQERLMVVVTDDGGGQVVRKEDYLPINLKHAPKRNRFLAASSLRGFGLPGDYQCRVATIGVYQSLVSRLGFLPNTEFVNIGTPNHSIEQTIENYLQERRLSYRFTDETGWSESYPSEALIELPVQQELSTNEYRVELVDNRVRQPALATFAVRSPRNGERITLDMQAGGLLKYRLDRRPADITEDQFSVPLGVNADREFYIKGELEQNNLLVSIAVTSSVPKRVRAEIRPVSADTTSQVYVIQDANIRASDSGLPVLELVAKDWPGASEFDIRFWHSSDDTLGTRDVRLDIESDTPREAFGTRVEVSREQNEFKIVETHPRRDLEKRLQLSLSPLSSLVSAKRSAEPSDNGSMEVVTRLQFSPDMVPELGAFDFQVWPILENDVPIKIQRQRKQ